MFSRSWEEAPDGVLYAAPKGAQEETQTTRGFRASPQADAWGKSRAPSGLANHNRSTADPFLLRSEQGIGTCSDSGGRMKNDAVLNVMVNVMVSGSVTAYKSIVSMSGTFVSELAHS